MESVKVRWVEASGYLNPPEARCGHVAAAINSREVWGEEFLLVHGGINRSKEALDDLVVLQCDQEAWFTPGPAAVGPAARAFHAGCAIGRKLYIFGGHVYVKQQHKLHQFNDLWCLDTDTWEWARIDVPPDAPAPCPRDRSSLLALGPTRLLLYGGADAMNRRLDDLWVMDLDLSTWHEVKTAGASKPRARCCTALVLLEQRVLMFGGDSYGVSNELWSLRGVVEGGSGEPAQWTELTLEGPAPAPRRGHAAATVGRWVLFQGGLTEQKSMLGIKSRNEYLADVVVLDRGSERVAWRGVEAAAAGEGPLPREKHTLTALSGGRLLLFGGTDGQTTLGDAWWLDLEDIVAPTPHTITAAELQQQPAQAPFALPPGAQEELVRQYQEQQRQYQQYQQQHLASAAGAGQQAGQQLGPAAGSGFAYLPASLATSRPAVPAGLSSAFNSFRERLGLPTTPSQSNMAGGGGGGVGAATLRPAARLGGALPPPVAYSFGGVRGSAGALEPSYPGSAAAEPLQDEALLSLGQRVLLERFVGATTAGPAAADGGAAAAAAAAGEAAVLPEGGWEPAALAQAARGFLASCRPEELRLGELPVLMADYRRLARVGWAHAVQQAGGLEALLAGEPAAGEGSGGGGSSSGWDLLQMPGRFLHLRADELRMREVPAVLADYQLLLASQTAGADS